MAEFDKFKNNYSDKIQDSLSFAGQSHDFYMRVKADHLIKNINAYNDNEKPIEFLDVGCGHGLIHSYIKNKSPKKISIHGVDPAEDVISMAKTSNEFAHYCVNSGDRLPYEDNSFDIVKATCVVHHVSPAQWENFLKEMKRVTKSGGLILIYEHNPYNPVTRHIVNNCELDENATLISSMSLKKIMRKIGLSDVHTEYLLFFPIENSLFRTLEKYMSWIPLGAQYVTIAKV